MENILEKSEKMILEMHEMKKETQKLIEKYEKLKFDCETILFENKLYKEYDKIAFSEEYKI